MIKKYLCFTLLIISCLVITACGKNPSSQAVNNVTDIYGETVAPPIMDNDNDKINENYIPDKTIGTVLCEEFEMVVMNNSEITLQDLMETIRSNPEIVFMCETQSVSAGNISGFNSDITGFMECFMLKPTIQTIPFVAYVFYLNENEDVETFEKKLYDNVNLKWNEVTEADEIVVTAVGRHVFCVISSYYFQD